MSFDRTDAHVETRLTNLAVTFKPVGMIGEMLFPTIPVSKESDKFVTFGAENMDLVDVQRGYGADSNFIHTSLSDTTYQCEEHSISGALDDRIIRNSDPIIKPKARLSYTLRNVLETRREYDIVTKVTSTSNVTNYTDLSTSSLGQWNDDSSEPFQAVDLGVVSVRDAIGILPNTMMISHNAFLKLKEHPAVIAKLGSNERGVIRADRRSPILEDLFQIERVFVGSSAYNAAKKNATKDLTQIWGTTVLIAYVAPNPGLETPSFGYGFQSQNYKVTSYRNNDKKSDIINVADIRDDKLCNATAGYLLTNVYA